MVFFVKTFLKEKLALPVQLQMIRRRLLACQFFLRGEPLYNNSYNNVLSRCADAKEANETMSKVHEGAHSSHMTGYMLGC